MKQNLTPSRLHAMTAAIGALALSLAIAQAETTENLDKSFNAKPGGKLVVEVDFGAIEVSSHPGDQVSVKVDRRVTRGDKADEETFLKDHPVVMSQEGDTVTIRSKSDSKGSWHWKSGQRTEGKYIIAVPSKFNTQIKTSGGHIELRDMEGQMDANTSGGHIAVKNVQGTIGIKTSGGHIEVAGSGGSLNGHTSGGQITVKSFKGDVNIHTSGGAIHIDDVAGKIEGATSGGSVSASLKALTDPVMLSTSGGGVTVSVPSDAAFNLDAATSGGGVSCDLPVSIEGKKSNEHLKGQVNGGGKEVHLRSSGGGVRVKKT